MSVFLFPIIFILIGVVGVVSPRTLLPFHKWQMKNAAKMFGFSVEPKSDDILYKKIRIRYSFFLGIGIAWLIFTIRGS
jgi:hypothetical protein